MAEPTVRFTDESGDTRLAGEILAPPTTPAGQTLVTTGTGGATGWQAGGGGGSLTVTDQTTTVPNVTTLEFINGVTVLNGGAGDAQVFGGASTIVVPINSAQILDLVNTPVTLISGVPGFVTVVQGFAVTYIAGITPYTDHGSNIFIENADHDFGWGGQATSGFWDQATSQTVVWSSSSAVQATQAAVADVAGDNTILSCSVANPTGGDGTLLVTLSYFLSPTVPPP